MSVRGGALRLVAVLAVALFGAGACALESTQRPADAEEMAPAAVSQGKTGVSASPGPNQGITTETPTPGPTAESSTSPRRGPATTPSATGSTGSTGRVPVRRPSGCPQGEHQRRVEGYLRQLGGYGMLTVDGVQSAADCKAIKKFQRRFGISPDNGRAGPTTLSVAKRLANTDTSKCDTGKALTICVNLTLQTVWAIDDGKVVFGPTITRTGMAGYATPAGKYRIGWRNRKEWSNPYEVWLPYWQQFHGGMGFHQTTTYIHQSSMGSHGCVNLLPSDARRLWELGKVGTRVYVFGHRAGT